MIDLYRRIGPSGKITVCMLGIIHLGLYQG